MTKTNAPKIYVTQILHKNPKDFNLSKLSVDLMVDPVAEWVDTGHSETETESESTELTIYISMADSVNFCLFPELFLFPTLPIIPEIIREQ